MKIKQTSKDKIWLDESGAQIPYSRVTKSERLMERSSYKIFQQAVDINSRLSNFKDLIRTLCQEAHEAFLLEKNITRKTKGNFTWFNFNRSIKIEVNVNEPIKFDPMTIAAAKEKFDEFLDKDISSKSDFGKQLVHEAFETQRSGNLDTKRVMGLSRHKKKVNDILFTEACDLIEQAIRKPQTKTYFRVWLKNEDGSYDNIDLNLSSIS